MFSPSVLLKRAEGVEAKAGVVLCVSVGQSFCCIVHAVGGCPQSDRHLEADEAAQKHLSGGGQAATAAAHTQITSQIRPRSEANRKVRMDFGFQHEYTP